MNRNLDLAVIGNGQVSALLDREGTIQWCCLPRPDSDPAFARLLASDSCPARDAAFSVSMRGATRAKQDFVRNTAILQTELADERGNCLRITDFCPRFLNFGRPFRPASLVRLIEPVSGRPPVTIHCRPHARYGALRLDAVRGTNHIRFLGGDLPLRLTTNYPISALLEESVVIVDEPVAILFGEDESPQESVVDLARRWLHATTSYWQEWVRSLAIPFEWQDAVIRAAIGLKLCTFDETGAILAALTTSIPEAANTGRNWDYRYCWLRDSYFVVQTLNSLGATAVMERYLRFLAGTVVHDTAPMPQPLYGITGAPQLEERIVDSLDGYRGMGPVRVGNAAWRQVQHDSYGALVLAVSQMFVDRRLLHPGNEALFRELETLGELAIRYAGQPDAGLWELRGAQRAHTYSSAMCWAACDRLAKIARVLGLSARREYWLEHAVRLHRTVSDGCWSTSAGSFVSHAGAADVDASLLLLPEIGFLPFDDPRFLATLARIERDLLRGTHLLRYAVEDDFGKPENAFNICTFWYINALAGVGRREEARALFDVMLKHRSASGLLSEDLDPLTGEPWGNYPQAYSLVGIIECARRLSIPWEQAL